MTDDGAVALRVLHRFIHGFPEDPRYPPMGLSYVRMLARPLDDEEEALVERLAEHR